MIGSKTEDILDAETALKEPENNLLWFNELNSKNILL